METRKVGQPTPSSTAAITNGLIFQQYGSQDPANLITLSGSLLKELDDITINNLSDQDYHRALSQIHYKIAEFRTEIYSLPNFRLDDTHKALLESLVSNYVTSWLAKIDITNQDRVEKILLSKVIEMVGLVKDFNKNCLPENQLHPLIKEITINNSNYRLELMLDGWGIEDCIIHADVSHSSFNGAIISNVSFTNTTDSDKLAKSLANAVFQDIELPEKKDWMVLELTLSLKRAEQKLVDVTQASQMEMAKQNAVIHQLTDENNKLKAQLAQQKAFVGGVVLGARGQAGLTNENEANSAKKSPPPQMFL